MTSGKATTPLVTCIVPIYNVENYLTECIDSILSQTYQNIEIILVNDKSLDGSGAIADNYGQQDERVNVIHKSENEGLNMARATGFKHSAGEYIMFIDSDDLITPRCIEQALKVLLQHDAGFVRFDNYAYNGEDNILKIIDDKNDEATAIEVMTNKREILRTNLNRGTITVWGALYTRKSIEQIDWVKTNYRIYEDNFWSLFLLEGVSRAVYCQWIGYLYRSSTGREAEVLSKRIAGNSFNNEPVGYLEFVVLIIAAYKKINKKYNLDCDQEIMRVEEWYWNNRLGQIAKFDEWQPEENDLPHIIKLLQWTQRNTERLESKSLLQAQYIDNLNKSLHQSEAKVAEFLGIKRSLRLLAGNAKRKIKDKMK